VSRAAGGGTGQSYGDRRNRAGCADSRRVAGRRARWRRPCSCCWVPWPSKPALRNFTKACNSRYSALGP